MAARCGLCACQPDTTPPAFSRDSAETHEGSKQLATAPWRLISPPPRCQRPGYAQFHARTTTASDGDSACLVSPLLGCLPVWARPLLDAQMHLIKPLSRLRTMALGRTHIKIQELTRADTDILSFLPHSTASRPLDSYINLAYTHLPIGTVKRPPTRPTDIAGSRPQYCLYICTPRAYYSSAPCHLDPHMIVNSLLSHRIDSRPRLHAILQLRS